MTRKILPLSVQTHTIAMQWCTRLADRARHAWDDRADESGIDEAVTKMIWLAVGIGVALAATTFFTGIFETARATVPDPVAP